MSANEEYTPLEVSENILKPIIFVYRTASIEEHESLTYSTFFTSYM